MEFERLRSEVVLLKMENERYRYALERLMVFGEKLMNSSDEDEALIGCCICEGARVVRER